MRRNLTTTQRGYGTGHQHTRAHLLPQSYGKPCPLCHAPMYQGQALDLDHTVPLHLNSHSTGDRIVHAHCNRGRHTTPTTQALNATRHDTTTHGRGAAC